jgi:hypothetical protein
MGYKTFGVALETLLGVGELGSWGVGVLGNVGKSRKVENKYDDGEKK